jgi:hypothetical protein
VHARLAFAVDVGPVVLEERERPIPAQRAAFDEGGVLDVGTVERLEREDAQPRDDRRYDSATSASPTATAP